MPIFQDIRRGSVPDYALLGLCADSMSDVVNRKTDESSLDTSTCAFVYLQNRGSCRSGESTMMDD